MPSDKAPKSCSAADLARNWQLEDGIGKPEGVFDGFKPGVSAQVDWAGPPALESLKFDSGAGDNIRVPAPCSGICGAVEYPAPGRYVATLTGGGILLWGFAATAARVLITMPRRSTPIPVAE